MGWLALRWLWCSLILYPRTLGWVQTEWQQQLLQQVNETALSMSKQGRQQLLERLDRTDVRTLLASCCPERAQLPAEALVHELRQALLATEVVSGFSTEVNRSFFSFSLSEAEEVDHYENLWEIWVRNHAEFSNYSYGMDWVETAFFGFKYFQHHAHPLGMEEARERSPYFLLNSLQVDAGSPLYGDVTVVLKPSFAHATAVISPFDSGRLGWLLQPELWNAKSELFPQLQCLPRAPRLGDVPGFRPSLWHQWSLLGKVDSILTAFSTAVGVRSPWHPCDWRRLCALLWDFCPPQRCSLQMWSLSLQIFPASSAQPVVFGLGVGAQRNGWLLLWSLGLNVGFSTDHGMPHFWDVFNMTGPFKNKQRLIDPYFLRLDPWRMSISTSDLDTFNASWWLLKEKTLHFLFATLWFSLGLDGDVGQFVSRFADSSCASLLPWLGWLRWCDATWMSLQAHREPSKLNSNRHHLMQRLERRLQKGERNGSIQSWFLIIVYIGLCLFCGLAF